MKPVVIIAIAFVLLIPSAAFGLEFAEKYDWEKEYGPGTSGIYIIGYVQLTEEFSGQQLEIYVQKPGDAKRLLDIVQIGVDGSYATVLVEQGGLPIGKTEVELRYQGQSYIGYITIIEDGSKLVPRYLDWNVDCSVFGQTSIIDVKEKPYGLPAEEIESYYYEIKDENYKVISSGTHSGDLIIQYEEFPEASQVALYSSQNHVKPQVMCDNYAPMTFKSEIQCPSKQFYDIVETRTNEGNTYSYEPRSGTTIKANMIHSPSQEIPNNYTVLAHYSDGSVKEYNPLQFDLEIPLKNQNGKLTKLTYSGENYMTTEKNVDCEITNAIQPVMESIYKSKQESDRASTEAKNYCNYLMIGCKVTYEVDYKIDAPNEFFQKQWTEENIIPNIKRLEYSFTDKSKNDYDYILTTYTNDNQRFSESGSQSYQMGSVFIMEDGSYFEDYVQYSVEMETMNIAGHNREIIHYWIDEEIDAFFGVGNIRQDYYYDYDTGLLLKMEFEREILDVAGTTNNEEYEMKVSSVNFPKQNSGMGGGCLIATATFDSELSPQVQKLREIRDSKLLQTESGSAFMESFNSFYYSFSPVIADYERENPVFKEMVKMGVTPLLTTLSLMDYAESESEVLTIGIGLIILNGMMYVGIPVIGIIVIRRF